MQRKQEWQITLWRAWAVMRVSGCACECAMYADRWGTEGEGGQQEISYIKECDIWIPGGGQSPPPLPPLETIAGVSIIAH